MKNWTEQLKSNFISYSTKESYLKILLSIEFIPNLKDKTIELHSPKMNFSMFFGYDKNSKIEESKDIFAKEVYAIFVDTFASGKIKDRFEAWNLSLMFKDQKDLEILGKKISKSIELFRKEKIGNANFIKEEEISKFTTSTFAF